MASKRKPKAKPPKAVEAWAVVMAGHIMRGMVSVSRGYWGPFPRHGGSGFPIRVRIVPIARKRRRVGK